MNTSPLPRLALVIAAVASALSAVPRIAAQQPPAGSTGQVPRIVADREDGEQEQIERRLEWFYGSRRQGISTDREMRRLRFEAVEQTRAALELQRAQSAAGIASPSGGTGFWVSKGPSPSTFGGWAFGHVAGRISAITADWTGGVLYLATASGGLWKSVDDGQSWTSVFDTAGTMTLGTVAVDPSNPDVVWAGTGENSAGCNSYFGIGLLRSPDGGATWELRNGTGGATLDDLASFADVVVDPRDSNHVVTGGRIRGCEDGSSSPGGIFTTDDGGLTWTERLPSREVFEIQQDPSSLDTFWAATSNGVYKSIDNAVSWTVQSASGLPTGNTGRTEIAIAPGDGNVVYALFDQGSNSFWRTLNGGASWTQMTTGSDACDGQCSYNMVLRVDPNDSDTVYRGTVRLFKTVDGGSNWSALTSSWGSGQKVHQDTHVLMMHPTQPDTFYVGSDGGLWKSENGGSTFTNRIGNLNITQFYAVATGASDPESIICGGAQDNSSLARTDSDLWDLQFVTGDGFVCQIDTQNPNRAYITSYPNGGFPSIYRSQTGLFGGYSEITNGNGINGGESSNWVTPYLLDPGSPNILFLGTSRMYRSTNFGSSWTPQGPSNFTAGGSNSMLSIDLNPNFPDHVWAGTTDGRVWRTVDSGDNWTNITSGLPSRSINDLASDPTDGDRVFAALAGFNSEHLWEWTEAGGWVARDNGLPNVPANTALLLGAGDILVGTDVGVYRSADGGQNFVPYMDGLPQGTVVTDLKLDLPDLVTAGTYGRGAWQIHVDPAQALVRFDSVPPIVQIDGDGDTKVEPGETWSAAPLLRNLGGLPALGVTARLTTDAPGVTVLEPSLGQFGDLGPGAVAAPQTAFRFVIDPTFPCGDTVTFDLVDIHSTNEPEVYPDALAAFSVVVLDHKVTPGGGGGGGGAAPITLSSTPIASADRRLVGDRVWLAAGGTDSTRGAGVDVPLGAIAVRFSAAGLAAQAPAGQLVIDASANGLDEYTQLEAGELGGSYDITGYRGQRVWLAFVQAAGPAAADAGSLEFLSLAPGDPICDTIAWPGSVQDTLYGLSGTDVVASWSESCNIGELPQTYSVQVGDLDLLQSTGTFSHSAQDAACDLVSPAQFTPGPGNEYYLVVPNAAAREGGFGAGTDGTPRPQGLGVCGAPREAVCP